MDLTDTLLLLGVLIAFATLILKVVEASCLSYDFAVRLGHEGVPQRGRPPPLWRKGTDRHHAGR